MQYTPDQQGMLAIKRLSAKAILPTRGSVHAAGLDLYASEGMIVSKNSRALVKTGLSLAIPPFHYGRIAPRSGLALNSGIDVGAGVIDSDYRGELCVLLFNFGENDFIVSEGMRIAQLIIEKILMPTVVEVDDLSSTERGGEGFGSTGTH
ncbi:hypothetical protein SteCoe_8520 [Stentor coeruleus]|uniref:Deoxyuridine 5'-triphosphate nucleotidohydrolase n=1 Tax=Stentor coeruleus TaxID=5963 RepID=A0A1R2CJZ2_9CILI|nr:hypothetical protein SteCoe_8520 [Stentor coeruleus]